MNTVNTGRLIGGVVCLAAAALLAILALVLPSDEFVFTVGDTNMPFLPSIILAVVGVALLATSRNAARGGAAASSAQALGETETADTATGAGAGAAAADSAVGAAAVADAAPPDADAPDADPPLSEKARLNKQLERMGWGAFLVMLGGFALVPDDRIPGGLWSIGLGVIWLGLNAARYSKGIKLSLFTTVLGLIALGSGILELAGLNSVGGAVFLILLGVYVIFKPTLDRRGLFGKAEES